MTRLGLLARLDAADGKEAELERLLTEARAIVDAEAGTTAWFALRFGHGEFGVFDAFEDEAGRSAHLGGGVVAALQQHAELLDGAPEIEKVEVLADKLTSATVSKGILLRLPIKESHAEDAAQFLRDGRDVVTEEAGTTAWFALKFEDGSYGVFDVFPDKKARRAHLLGRIPQQLALHGLPWLHGLPHLSTVDVLAQKL